MPVEQGTPFRALDQFKDQANEALQAINQREGFKVAAMKQSREDALLGAVTQKVGQGKSIYDPDVAPLASALAGTSHENVLPFLEAQSKANEPIIHEQTPGGQLVSTNRRTGVTTPIGPRNPDKASVPPNLTLDEAMMSPDPIVRARAEAALTKKKDIEGTAKDKYSIALKERQSTGFTYDDAGNVIGFKGNQLKGTQLLDKQLKDITDEYRHSTEVANTASQQNQMIPIKQYQTDANGNQVVDSNGQPKINPEWQNYQNLQQNAIDMKGEYDRVKANDQAHRDAIKKSSHGGGTAKINIPTGRKVSLATALKLAQDAHPGHAISKEEVKQHLLDKGITTSDILDDTEQK